MKKTYIHISVTNYSHHMVEPSVHYYFSDGEHPATSRHDLSPACAKNMMWKLIKLGGESSYHSNPFNPAISVREVTFWGQL